MKTKTVIAAALASVFAVTAAAPSFAAGDPAKHQRRIHRMIHRADTNGDGRVSQAEMEAALAASFAVLDVNHDGALSKSEIDNRREIYKAYRQRLKAERQAGKHVAGVIRLKGFKKHFAKLDTNGDGVISKGEIDGAAAHQFKRRDRNGDGYISATDFKA
jgi:Ca2+-binding EF-hand superfamily protein